MNKKALITGITGQDGSFLAEFLLEQGYEVHGLVRRSSTNNLSRLESIVSQIKLHTGDVTDPFSVIHILRSTQFDEIYNLAAMSDVKTSFDSPEYTCNVNGLGLLRLLEAVRSMNPNVRIYQSSTSELFGNTSIIPQNEETPFAPCSPYALSKQYAFGISKMYRNAYGLYVANGILFNHESERRGTEFVTRKITYSAGRIAEGLQDCVELGNLDSKRDWGYAKDYVVCMWKMLQANQPDDYIVATGEQHSVREFAEKAFAENGILIQWTGKGLNEKGINIATGKTVIRVNKELMRPLDVPQLVGNPSKAIKELGWNPKTTAFDELVRIMAKHDRLLAKRC